MKIFQSPISGANFWIWRATMASFSDGLEENLKSYKSVSIRINNFFGASEIRNKAAALTASVAETIKFKII